MRAIFDEIWRLAKPHLNTRKNDIHTEIATRFGAVLLEKEGGDEDVVIPAIILHDVGWKMIPESQLLRAFGPNIKSLTLRKKHEEESIKIARRILKEVNYDKNKTNEILEIVEGHDTREVALSLNDSIVKDADKLWRFSKQGFTVDCERFRLKPTERVKAADMDIDRLFFTKSAIQIARIEIKRRLKESKGDKN